MLIAMSDDELLLFVDCRIAICSVESRRSVKITSSLLTDFPTNISDGVARTTTCPNGKNKNMFCLINYNLSFIKNAYLQTLAYANNGIQ